MLKIAFVIAAVSYCVFFGSVLDPRLPHYVLQGVAFVMLLPFGPLIFIPGAVEVRLDSWILLFSSLSWGLIYLWLLLRAIRSFRHRFCERVHTNA